MTWSLYTQLNPLQEEGLELIKRHKYTEESKKNKKSSVYLLFYIPFYLMLLCPVIGLQDEFPLSPNWKTGIINLGIVCNILYWAESLASAFMIRVMDYVIRNRNDKRNDMSYLYPDMADENLRSGAPVEKNFMRRVIFDPHFLRTALKGPEFWLKELYDWSIFCPAMAFMIVNGWLVIPIITLACGFLVHFSQRKLAKAVLKLLQDLGEDYILAQDPAVS